jgi:undecaprenyl-diphosphatase
MQRMTIGVTSFDRTVRGWMMAHQQDGMHRFFDAVSTIGGVSPLDWAGIVLALVLLARGRRRAALGVGVSPFLSLMAYTGTRRVVSRERPPSAAGLHEASNSFPSAHSTTATAVCCTVAYVLWRERMLSAPAAISLAIVPPALIGASRLYLDVHWATDVIAGWIAGLVITVVAALVYRRVGSLER